MTVYVVQQHMRKNRHTGNLEPTFDLSPAESFGELRFCFGQGAAPWNAEKLLPELREALSGLTEDDHILLVGNPVLIGLVSAVAVEYVDRVTFLQWSGQERRYIEIPVTFYDGEDD